MMGIALLIILHIKYIDLISINYINITSKEDCQVSKSLKIRDRFIEGGIFLIQTLKIKFEIRSYSKIESFFYSQVIIGVS
jgi:hypothetical protein